MSYTSHQVFHFDLIQKETIIVTCTEILNIIFSDYTGPVAIKLWDKNYVIGNDSSECTIIFNKAYPLRELFIQKDLTCLLEAYLYGDIDVKGNMESLFCLVDYLQKLKLPLGKQIKILLAATRMPRTKNDSKLFHNLKAGDEKKKNDKKSIAHHYDVGNDFYRLFLDPEMVYSCAYFSSPDQSLMDAQRDKLDYICHKLRLKPGMNVLDIGCGWGGLAIWAAQNYGVNVHGITLSHEQFNFATSRVNKLGLNDKVKVELLDYRKLTDDIIYDRIVSVGMFEHIGINNFPIYFGMIKGLLKPDGLFLNHGITNESGWLRTPITRFINDYIFPDGELARISTVISAMEDACFEIIDCEALRPHYDLTLRNWVKALERNSVKAVTNFDEPTYRLWRLYMAGSAHYFEQGSLGVYQVLACNKRQPWSLPLRREDLYKNEINKL